MRERNLYPTASLTDTQLKDQGNQMFSARKYEDVISCDSKPISRYNSPFVGDEEVDRLSKAAISGGDIFRLFTDR